MPRHPARTSSGRYVSRLTGGTLAVIMAGGRGERLKALTEHRCKPASPFGGKFRIIDFVLSNCVNSGIRQIAILTQYKAQSLIQHVERGWSYLRGEFGEFIEVIPAQQQIGELWYRGTADAVYQNMEIILSHRPKHVLVLAGDHIYKMDYGPMIAYHVEKGADITVGVVEVPRDQSIHFGVLTATEWNRVTQFAEKPAVQYAPAREAARRGLARCDVSPRFREEYPAQGDRPAADLRLSVPGCEDPCAELLARRRHARRLLRGEY
jgi:glucose-1-phosphate adenylyltransferase